MERANSAATIDSAANHPSSSFNSTDNPAASSTKDVGGPPTRPPKPQRNPEPNAGSAPAPQPAPQPTPAPAAVQPAPLVKTAPNNIRSTVARIPQTEEEGRALIEDIKGLAVRLRTSGQDNKKFQTLKGYQELLNRFDEILAELQGQYSKILQAMSTAPKTIIENVYKLKLSMNEIEDFYSDVGASWMFLSKSRLKIRMQNHYQSLRARLTQLMTAVSLELLSGQKPPPEEPISTSELYRTGLYYFYGIHNKPKNYVFAFEHFIRGAEYGDEEAMFMTAKCYLAGYGIEENFHLGLKWLEKAANSGHCPHAKTEIAVKVVERLKENNPQLIKEYFAVVENNNNNGVTTTRESINNLTSTSMDNLSVMDEVNNTNCNNANNIDADFEHDLQYAMKLLLEAAAEGHIEAKTHIGSIYEEYGDYEQAAKWYSLASNGGCSRGTCLLGNLLFFSKSSFVGSRQKAFSLFSMAAKNGQADGYNGLGLCFESGLGTDINISLAIINYRMGAKLGSAQAMYNLGYILVKNAIEILDDLKKRKSPNNKHNNTSNSNVFHDEYELYTELGIRVDDALTEGIHWLRAAAENRVADAAFQMGRLYEQVSRFYYQ
jgi:TPR repeat protein